MNHLERIVAQTRRDLRLRREAVAEDELEHAVAGRIESGDFRPFETALRQPGVSLIAEHKRRSPSAGVIRDDLSLQEVVAAYERGGAAALSILTDGPSFGGSLQDLSAAREASRLPILRKDFIVDPHQVKEAVLAGADAILLIVAALSERKLVQLRAQAAGLGLATLVEVHDERELETALHAGACVIGINNRDLTTLEVDIRRTFALAPRVPDGVTIVAESGFATRAELQELEDAGIDAVLMGEALMRAVAIEEACRQLTLPRLDPL